LRHRIRPGRAHPVAPHPKDFRPDDRNTGVREVAHIARTQTEMHRAIAIDPDEPVARIPPAGHRTLHHPETPTLEAWIRRPGPPTVPTAPLRRTAPPPRRAG